MSNYITTYTGLHFYPTEPNPDGLRMEDIAHALSLLCRGNGQTTTFFSMGQHCLHCAREAQARGYSRRVALACLLHDASEAYLSDVPRPFKQSMPQYRVLENRLLDVIYTKFLGAPLTDEEAALVKQIDDDMLYFDLRLLLNEPSNESGPEMKSAFSYDVLPFETVEREYLELYKKLS